MRIRVNSNFHDEDGIRQSLLKKDQNLNIVKMDRIYYPYALSVHEIKMKNPRSTMNRKILCVMDLVKGRGAIADAEPSLEEAEVDDVLVVPPCLSGEELEKKTHDYVFQVILQKLRVLYVPEILVVREEFFHKLFYVVQGKSVHDEDYFLLVDSMDGSFTSLNV